MTPGSPGDLDSLLAVIDIDVSKQMIAPPAPGKASVGSGLLTTDNRSGLAAQCRPLLERLEVPGFLLLFGQGFEPFQGAARKFRLTEPLLRHRGERQGSGVWFWIESRGGL